MKTQDITVQSKWNPSRLVAVVALTLGICLAAEAIAPGRTDALTFIFTCQIVTSLTPDQCIEGGSGGPAGPFGTLTLTDSIIDPNRVDISWNMTPQWGTKIERVLLNWAGPPPFPITAPDLYVVAQDAPAGSTTNIPGVTRIFGNNGQGQGNTYQFDIRVNEASPNNDLTFAGSLYLTSGNGSTIINLSPASFLATSNNLNGATPSLYALYATAQPGTIPPGWTTSNGTEFWAGVTSVQDQVPEPSTWLLMSLGLVGLAVWRWKKQTELKTATGSVVNI